MRGIVRQAIVLTWTACVAAAGIPLGASSPQTASGGIAGETLPKDVYPDSRNRLPMMRRDDLDERGKKAFDEAVSATGAARGSAL